MLPLKISDITASASTNSYINRYGISYLKAVSTLVRPPASAFCLFIVQETQILGWRICHPLPLREDHSTVPTDMRPHLTELLELAAVTFQGIDSFAGPNKQASRARQFRSYILVRTYI